MSDRARNYVKQLPRSRVSGAQKKFLFFVADYHNVASGVAWPGLDTLADDMGITKRQVRNLLVQCVDRQLISWTPGLGNGNLGKFVFLELDAKAKEEHKEEQKEEIKEEGKGEIDYRVIRKNLEPGTLIPEHEDHHGSAAMRFWIGFKEQLKIELGIEEWNQWVRPIYFLKELDHNFLLLSAPPNNKILSAYRKREAWLRQKLSELGGYSCGLTRYPEEWELERLAQTSPEWADVAARLSRKKQPASVSA